MPSKISVDQIAHSNETNALEIDTSGNVTIQQDLKFAGNAAIKDSAGNNVISESAGLVTVNADAAVISGSSTGDLVRITQTGSGNALVVEDSANPDSTPFVVDASGNVGIGTSSPTNRLHIVGGNATGFLLDNGGEQYTQLLMQRNGTANTGGDILIDGTASTMGIRSLLAGSMTFSTSLTTGSPVERIRIDSSGNVGINTAPDSNSKLHILDDTSSLDDYTIQIESYTPAIVLHDISGASTDFAIQVDGSALMFRYGDASTGTQLASEAMRIDSDGNLLVGTTSSIGSGKLAVKNNSADAIDIRVDGSWWGINLRHYNAGDQPFQAFRYGTTLIGSIGGNNTSTTFNTTSDYRLKENITDITDGISRVKQLNPSRFNFIAEPNRTVDGFIAHEVQPIVPEAISGEKDAVNEDGSIVPQGIDQSKLVPLLTAALQESIALIESQQSQIDALTARIEALESN